MRKSPVARKTSYASIGSKKSARTKEQEQLYFVRKSANGKPSNSNGFRHHRPKEKRGDASAPPRVVDPDTAQIDYADNERGAINKLLALNEYYRSHPWPAPLTEPNIVCASAMRAICAGFRMQAFTSLLHRRRIGR